MKVSFTIDGEPQGKGRPKTRVHQGRSGRAFAQVYTPAGTRAYEQRVIEAFRLKYPDHKVWERGFPLAMLLKAYCPIPSSTSRVKREQMYDGLILPTKKPDADNILKIVCDALNGVVYEDDTQITDIRLIKVYDNTPRVEVTIMPAMRLNKLARNQQKTEEAHCRMVL